MSKNSHGNKEIVNSQDESPYNRSTSNATHMPDVVTKVT